MNKKASVSQLQKKTPTSQELQAMPPKKRVAAMLDASKNLIEKALPKHMNAERLTRVAIQSITTTPALLECYTPTLIQAVIQCSAMGLEPNTVMGHAYLVPFNNRKKGRKDVQVIVGYKGLIDLARRSGQIVSIAAHAVYSNDFFEYEYGLNEKLVHRPDIESVDRGHIVAFYAIAHMKDQGYAYEVMSNAAVKEIMLNSQSKGKHGPWKDHYEEMGRKTAIRRLSKFLPLSVEMVTALDLDEKASLGKEQDLSGALDCEWTIEEEKHIAQSAGVNTETGEITPPEAAVQTGVVDDVPPSYATEPGPGAYAEHGPDADNSDAGMSME